MSNQGIYDEKKVLLLLSQGSEYAFTQIFDQYKSRIYGVAIRILKSPVAAEEVVQDVFLKIWLNRVQVIDIQRFDNYLFIIARNFIYDRIKKNSYEIAAQKKLSGQIDYVEDADYLSRHHECQQILEAAISQLTKQQQLIYRLSRVDGLSHKQIGERLNISTLTVKAHMAKALQSIRRYLIKNRLESLFLPVFLIILEK